MKELLNFLEENQEIKLFTSLIIIVPLSFILSLLPNTQMRLLFSSLLGLLFQFHIFKVDCLHNYVLALVTLLTIQLSPRRFAGRFVFALNFIYVMTVMLRNFIFFYGEYRNDISVLLMVSLLKNASLAFNYSDFERSDIHELQKPFLVENFSCLDLIGYTLYLPTCLVGPFVEFSDYKQGIEATNNIDSKANRFYAASKKTLVACFFAILFLTFGEFTDVHVFLKREDNISKVLYFYLLAYRKIMYYAPFLISEAAVISAGSSFDEKTGRHHKNTTVNVVGCETSIKIKDYFENWNIATHKFHKRYVFSKVKRYVGNQIGFFVTFIFSGIWHGVYPNYGFLFAVFGLIYNLELITMRLTGKLGSIIKFIHCSVMFLLIVPWAKGTFQALEIGTLVEFHKQIYFVPLIGSFVLSVLVFFASMVKQKVKTN